MNFTGFKTYNFKTSDGFNIHYGHNFESLSQEVLENKPTLILNYGLVCNLAHWKYQLPYFHNLDYPILYHDYRFHYQSSSSTNINDLNFDKISNDIHELLSYLKPNSPIMIGHSMGVNTALHFSHLFPNELKGMVLISGTVLPPQDIMFDSNWMELIQPILEYLLDSYPKLFKMIWKTSYQNPLANFAIHRGGFNTKKVPLDFVKYYLKKIGELNPEVFFQLLNEMKKQNITAKLNQLDTPTLVMAGDLDQVIPSYLQKILTDHLPNSEFYLIKDGSHVPQADFPKTVNERMKIFIDEI